MNDIDSIEKYLSSNSGIIYTHNETLYYSDIARTADKAGSDNYVKYLNIDLTKLQTFYLSSPIELPPQTKSIQSDILTLYPIGSDIFTNDFKKIKEAIRCKQIDKGLWYNRYKFKFSLKDQKIALIKNALRNHTHHLVILWDENNLSITHSPELLYTKDGNQFVTDCIAGTASNLSELENEKFLKEQENVITNMTNKLDNLNIKYDVGTKTSIKYGDYYHLKNTIVFNSDLDTSGIIYSLAPSSAVYGNPTSEFQKLTKSLKYHTTKPETFYASFYGGIIELNINETNKAIVNIRNISANHDKAEIITGCGIIKESEYRYELEESKLKARSVLNYSCG